MFEYLKDYDNILVTGPQRSGTTITSKMIAHDTGFNYVDEMLIHVANVPKLKEILSNSKHNVIQCPGLCSVIDELADERTAIVLMRRDVDDIEESQERINWRSEPGEIKRFVNTDKDTGGFTRISEIKYYYWDNYQKDKIQNAFEIPYESISEHPFYVEKKDRKDFNPKQTQIKSEQKVKKESGLRKRPSNPYDPLPDLTPKVDSKAKPKNHKPFVEADHHYQIKPYKKQNLTRTPPNSAENTIPRIDRPTDIKIAGLGGLKDTTDPEITYGLETFLLPLDFKRFTISLPIGSVILNAYVIRNYAHMCVKVDPTENNYTDYDFTVQNDKNNDGELVGSFKAANNKSYNVFVKY